jgi:hypothetical protein
VVPCTGCTALRLDIFPEHMVFDAQRGRLYLSVAASAPLYENTIVTVDAVTGAIVGAMLVGSQPRSLALSDDASTLWVGIDGALAIRKVTLTTTPVTLGPLVKAPQSNVLGLPGTILSMVGLPGAPGSVAVEMLANVAAGTYVLDDGAARATNTSLVLGTQSTVLARGPAGYVFGYNGASSGFDFITYVVSSTGVTQTSVEGLVSGFGLTISSDADRVYASSGDIVDVSSPGKPVSAGRFASSGAVAPRDGQRVLMWAPSAGRVILLDKATRGELGSVTLPSSFVGGGTIDFVYLGGDGVAALHTVFDTSTLVETRAVFIVHAAAIAAP